MRRHLVAGLALAATVSPTPAASAPAPYRPPAIVARDACDGPASIAAQAGTTATGYLREAGASGDGLPKCRRVVLLDGAGGRRVVTLPEPARSLRDVNVRTPHALRFAADGSVLAAWLGGTREAPAAFVATLPPGASAFGAPEPLPAGSDPAIAPTSVAVDGAGIVFVAMADGRILERPLGGTWLLGVDLRSAPTAFDVAPSGAAVATTTRFDGEVAVAATRSPAGSWTELEMLGGDLPGGVPPVAAVSDAGEVLVAWARGAGSVQAVSAAAGTSLAAAARVETGVDLGAGGRGIGVVDGDPPLLALDVAPDGRALLAARVGGSIAASGRPPGGAWDAPRTLVRGTVMGPLALASATGDVVVVDEIAPSRTTAFTRPAGSADWSPTHWLSAPPELSSTLEPRDYPVAASDGDRVAVAWAQAPRIWRAPLFAPDGRGTRPSLAVSAVRARLQRDPAPCGVANGRRYCASAPLRVTVLLQATGRGELEASFERVGVRVSAWWFLRARPGANRLSFRLHEFFGGRGARWRAGSRWRLVVHVPATGERFTAAVSLEGVARGTPMTVALPPAGA